MSTSRPGRLFSRGLALIVSAGALTIAGCEYEPQGPSVASSKALYASSFSARLYGQVTLAASDSAAAGVSIVVTLYEAGCTGKIAGMFLNQTTTDADGRFGVTSTVWGLPPGNAYRRVLCASITASGKLPGDTASVLIPDLVHRRVIATDSTRADLRLPSGS